MTPAQPKLKSSPTDQAQRWWRLSAWLVIIIFAGLRVWRLSRPAEPVFDEVYFPKMAHQYLTGEAFFDIHPPLGKLIIALGELIAGNSPLGWRLMSLLAGLAIIPTAAWTSYQLFAQRRAALLTALLVAIDGLFVVYARVGLMDSFIILFGLAAVGWCWRFRRLWLAEAEVASEPMSKTKPHPGRAWLALLLTGIFAGLAAAVKWIGAGFLPIVAVTTGMTILTRPTSAHSLLARPAAADAGRRRLNTWLIWLVSFIALPAVIYTLPFLANWRTDFWSHLIEWHQQAWGYNIHLTAGHPYASKWWSWPFLLRPIWFYYKADGGRIIGIDAIGNPIVWWGSTLAVVYTLTVLVHTWVTKLTQRRIGRVDHGLTTATEAVEPHYLAPLLFGLVGWAALYLPWAPVHRVIFLYHYFSAYLFALLLSGFWLDQAMTSLSGRRTVLTVLGLAVVVGLAFSPIWIGYPIAPAWFNHLMWWRSWI